MIYFFSSKIDIRGPHFSTLVTGCAKTLPWGRFKTSITSGVSEIDTDYAFSPGDQVHFSPTEMDRSQHESKIVNNTDFQNVKLNSPFKFSHSAADGIFYKSASNVVIRGSTEEGSENFGGRILSRGQLIAIGVKFQNFAQRGFSSPNDYRSALNLKSNSIVKFCIFENIHNTGIYATDAQNVNIYGNLIVDGVEDGFRISGNIQNFTIISNVVMNIRHRLIQPVLSTQGNKGFRIWPSAFRLKY